MGKPYIIIALGGSVIAPNGIDVKFLKRFRYFLRAQLKKRKRFIIVAGGGAIARHYQEASAKIVPLSNEDKDWLGIHSTRLNAHLLRTLFMKESYPVVFDNPHKLLSRKAPKDLIIASGWRPGRSTDYIAMLLAKRFGIGRVIIAGHPDFVYTKDYTRHKGAKPIPRIHWREYQQLVPRTWKSGLKAPVDPIAAKLARASRIEAIIIRGTDLKNFARLLAGYQFRGTIIR